MSQPQSMITTPKMLESSFTLKTSLTKTHKMCQSLHHSLLYLTCCIISASPSCVSFPAKALAWRQVNHSQSSVWATNSINLSFIMRRLKSVLSFLWDRDPFSVDRDTAAHRVNCVCVWVCLYNFMASSSYLCSMHLFVKILQVICRFLLLLIQSQAQTLKRQ